jgi:hypothetical protein
MEVCLGGQVLWRTTRFGLRASEPDRARKLAVIWGDSVIFGGPGDIGTWVPQLDCQSHQVISGGVPGCPLIGR